MFREDSAAGRGEDLISPFTCKKNNVRNKLLLLSLLLDSIVTHLLLPQGSPVKWDQFLHLKVELRIGTLDARITKTVLLQGDAHVFHNDNETGKKEYDFNLLFKIVNLHLFKKWRGGN